MWKIAAARKYLERTTCPLQEQELNLQADVREGPATVAVQQVAILAQLRIGNIGIGRELLIEGSLFPRFGFSNLVK